jgi:hypothetical protein
MEEPAKELVKELLTRMAEAAGKRAAESMRNECLRLAEARRLQVLRNPADPSWTEHFAELQTQIRGIEI